MSSQLTVEELANRLNSFPYDRFLYIGSFMRSVAWAAGTVVLLEILRNRTTYLPRLLPWIVSFLATMVTLMTWGRGVLFTNSRANLSDSVLPTLMGIVEFCLFAILAPPGIFGGEGTKSDLSGASKTAKYFGNFQAWHLWFFFFAAHTTFAVMLVRNRIKQTIIDTDFEVALRPLANKYVAWMKADEAGALTATKAALISGVLMVLAVLTFKYSKRLWIRSVLGIMYVALFVMPVYKLSQVIIAAENQRQEADAEISRVKASSKASEMPATITAPRQPLKRPRPKVRKALN